MTDEMTTEETAPEATTPPFRRRIPAWLPLVVAAVVIGGGGFGLWKAVQGPGTETVKGAIQVGLLGMAGTGTAADGNFNQGDPCSSADGYTDVGSGAEVDVLDASGKVLATGALGDGHAGPGGVTCDYLFTVADVPRGQSIYGVKIGNANRGVVHFTAKQMDAGPVLSLG